MNAATSQLPAAASPGDPEANASANAVARRRTGPWRATLRFARRELLRAKARSALVVTLVALPVAAMVFALVVIASTTLSPRDRALVGLGSVADARFDAAAGISSGASGANAATTAQPDLPLPDLPHADVTEWYYGRAAVGGGYPYVHLLQGDLADTLLRGAYSLRAGAPAVTPDDVVVSDALARARRVRIGDRVTLRRSGQSWTVTGVYRNAEALDDLGLLVNRAPTGIAHADVVHRFVRASDEQLDAAGGAGLTPTVARTRLGRQPPDSQDRAYRRGVLLVAYVLGTIALGVLGVVVSAAFAVSARRQLRSLGLVAASGASPALVRRVVTLQGAVVGVAGVATGGLLGAAGIAVFAPRLDRYATFVVPGLRFPRAGFVGAAATAVAVATLAAAVPARAVARGSILQALAGRRPLAPMQRRVPFAAIALVSFGLAGVVVMSVQPPANQAVIWIGFVCSSGALLAGGVLAASAVVAFIAGVVGRRGGAARLAARAMARNRARTGPIAGAILVTTAVAATAGVIGSTHERFGDHAVTPLGIVQLTVGASVEAPTAAFAVPASAIERVRAMVPNALVQRFSYLGLVEQPAIPSDSWEPAADLAVDPNVSGPGAAMVTSDRAALTAARVPGDAIDAWERGSVLAFGPDFVTASTARFVRRDPATGRAVDERAVPAVQLDRQLADPVNDAGASFCQSDASIAATDNTSTSTSSASSRAGSGTASSDSTSASTAGTGTTSGASTGGGAGGTCTTRQTTILLLPDRLARDFNLGPVLATVSFRLARPLDRSQRAALRALASDLRDDAATAADAGGDDLATTVTFADDPVGDPRLWLAFLTIAATALALSVTAIGLALGAAESRTDDATMLALGAPPRQRRSLRGWEALLTTAAGTVPGVALGTLTGLTFAVARSHRPNAAGRLDIGVPWDVLAALALVLPLVAAVVFWLTTRSRRVVLVRDD